MKLETATAEARAFEKGPMRKANKLYNKLCTVERPEPWMTPMLAKIAKTIPPIKWSKQRRKDLTVGEYSILKKYRPNHPAVRWTDQNIKDGEKRRAPFENAHREAIKKSAVINVEEEYMALWNVAMELCDQIVRSPAHSILGLQLKVNAIKLVGDDHDEYGGPLERAWLTGQRDILRLSA